MAERKIGEEQTERSSSGRAKLLLVNLPPERGTIEFDRVLPIPQQFPLRGG
jgi:hypothetical protein